MARTAEQVLRQLVAEQLFQIAQLIAQVESSNEKLAELEKKIVELGKKDA